jgi:hypothetical protein
MAPNKPNLRQQAEQGNPEAIATIFNQFFQRKGLQDVEATAERTDGWLYLTLQAPQVPNQEVFVKTIRQGMERIGCNEIHTVQVEGYQSDSDTPGWSEQIQLQSADLSVFEQYNPESETEEAAASASTVAAPAPEEFSEEQTEQEYSYSWEEESSSQGDTGDTEPAVRKRRRGLLPILGVLLLLVLVGAVGLVYYVRLIPGWGWPEKWPRPVALDLSHLLGKGESSEQSDSSTPTSTSQPSTSSSSPEATDETKPEPSPEAPPSPDPWREGVNKATEAAELAQNANSQSEWNQVQQLWQQAANAMAEVPQDHPKYETAQQKVNEYQQNAEIASQRAAQAGS